MSGLLSDSGTGFNLVCNLVYMSDWPVISPEKTEKFNKVSSKYDKKILLTLHYYFVFVSLKMSTGCPRAKWFF